MTTRLMHCGRQRSKHGGPPCQKHDTNSPCFSLRGPCLSTPMYPTRVIQFSLGRLTESSDRARKRFPPREESPAQHSLTRAKTLCWSTCHESTASAPHRGLRRDPKLSLRSGQTPSLARHSFSGLLCDVVWLS